jgi:lysophospholipase L1-like esterase
MLRFLLLLVAGVSSLQAAGPEPLLRPGDRVAFVGSSSTFIGVWPKTIQFLLRTRHPEMKLAFKSYTTGGGTFATGLGKLDPWFSPAWLDDFKPTVVLFNYGSNDAGAGEKGLPGFKANLSACIEQVTRRSARSILMTPQAADVRKAGEAPAARRQFYAETMLAFSKEKGWPIVDVFHPLDQLQKNAQADDDKFTILKDTIHLTDAGYVAWGYFLYERLGLAAPTSRAILTARGEIVKTEGCRLADVKVTPAGLTFTRRDAVLPILPPVALPPRKHVPLEQLSGYLLSVTDLPAGKYTVSCEGKQLGTATEKELAAGVNLNSLLLDSGNKAPWEAVAKEWWQGKNLEQIGATAWSFEVARQ